MNLSQRSENFLLGLFVTLLVSLFLTVLAGFHYTINQLLAPMPYSHSLYIDCENQIATDAEGVIDPYLSYKCFQWALPNNHPLRYINPEIKE